MKGLSYIFETGAILLPTELTNAILDEKPYHYYMIVSCPQLYIKDCYGKDDAIAFILTDGTNDIEIVPPKDGNYSIKNVCCICIKPSRLSIIVKYSCVFPDGSEKECENEFWGLYLYFFYVEKKKFRIEYIGQSYANDGHRTAQERLSDHSTLQKIISDYKCSLEPREVLLILLGADISIIDNSSITGKPSPIITIDDTEHPDYVNLLEACLINQFKPKYNVIYKNGVVPSTKHNTYNEAYKEKYKTFSINVAIYGSRNDYILYTDSKTVEINGGILLEKDRLCINFEDATFIEQDKFIYSFWDYKK